MGEPIRWIGGGVGLLIVVATWHSVLNTLVLPRTITSYITYLIWIVMQGVFRLALRVLRGYSIKDRWLAYLGPLSLMAILLGWLLLFLLGYALILWPLIEGDFAYALQLAGSSMLTLGIASVAYPGPISVEYLAAVSGLIVVALLVGYLPTLYGSYNRRETLVATLQNRLDSPAWGPLVLARHSQDHALATLPALFAAWEPWAADLAESHTSYPSLMVFRSQEPLQAWSTGWLAVLDAAALYLALAPRQAPPEARHCLRTGIIAFHRLMRALDRRLPLTPTAAPAIGLTYEQFQEGISLLEQAGFPIEEPLPRAWQTFQQWRAFYEKNACDMADFTVAFPTPWSGSRRFLSSQEVEQAARLVPPKMALPDEIEQSQPQITN